MSRFVRQSKYRHVFVKTNPLFLSVNWNAGGGGAFVVIPLEKTGKLSKNFPLFSGHSGPVLDTDFANFNDHVIASASEDGKVMIWNIPEFSTEGEEVENLETAAVTLHGHNKKVGGVLFHPTADNVLASSSADLTIKLWDIESGKQRQELTGHGDLIQSFTWNWNGNLIASTCRDKKIRIFDARSNKIVQEGNGHQGIKGSRVAWLGNSDRMVTTGFSRSSDRQINVWNTGDLSKPVKKMDVDTSSGILMPFFDSDVKILYVAGKRWKYKILRICQ
ncbi:Coronin-like protein crn1 [Entomophthora muscae]|uniref:Coronin-like protein crn1 n=1 Tax=Entomophthora muscae TaxID=34485 RepID=A0ACC2S2Z8_9FUNG|nr:Coronin-like protein crn1 [Entomophthora muscae]